MFKFKKDQKFNHEIDFNPLDYTILLTLSGSKAYGTDNENSDTDYRGIFVLPIDLMGSPYSKKGGDHEKSLDHIEEIMWKGSETTGRVSEIKGIPEADEEGTIFELRKFARESSRCNPNFIEALWADEKSYVIKTDEARILIDNRDMFLCQNAHKAFTGYAMSQLGRINTHKKWLLDPPSKPPERKDFGLNDVKPVSDHILSTADSYVKRHMHMVAPWLLANEDFQYQEEFWVGLQNIMALMVAEQYNVQPFEYDKWQDIKSSGFETIAKRLGFDTNFIELLSMEKSYSEAVRNYASYQGWKKNRNVIRSDLESRYGYDVKHAMHLVRLLRMGIELITTGNINVYRPDREELKQIRNGSMTYDEIIEYANEKRKEINNLITSGKCVLPAEPDRDKIREICLDIQKRIWKKSL